VGGLLLLAAGAARAQNLAQEDQADDPMARSQWLYEQRAFPLGFIPAGARGRALRQLDRMLLLESQRALKTSAAAGTPPPPESTSQWVNIGPRPTNNAFAPWP